MKLEAIAGQPVIPSDRFTLRPPRRSDAGLFDLYTGDARVARATTRIPHPLPPGTSAAFIERARDPKRTEDVWVLDGSANGLDEVLGVVSLKRMDGDRSEVGYWVAPAFWNTGFASEAVRTLMEANPHDSATVFAQVFQSNAVSARVLTNIGFAYIGDAEAYSVSQDRTVPTWTYLKKLR